MRSDKTSVKDKLLDILFPSRVACCACGREAVLDEEGFCIDCRMGLEVFNAAPPLNGISGYTAAYVYNDVSGQMVKRLKYNGAKYAACELARAIKLPKDWKIDAVVPVPLYYRREAKRGFNQSLLIAKHLCKMSGLKLRTDLLVRTKETLPQARMSAAKRKRNLKGSFAADEKCRGLSILLVDDVRTTGSTLMECASALKKCGCEQVYAATACFAEPNK